MKRIVTLTALALGATVVGAAPALAAESTTPTKGCTTGTLPAVVVGNPAVKAQAAEGAYLWHGADGWSLRVTHPGKQAVKFSGTITVSNTVGALKRVKTERHDHVAVGPQRHTVSFTFTNHGAIDGITFGADCSATLTLKLSIDGHAATTSQVFLGKARTAPSAVPVVVTRVSAA